MQLQKEKDIIRDALKEAIQAIERLQEHAKNLEGQLEVLQERVKTLERQQAKDSHNSSLSPSSDRFVRTPKSLNQLSPGSIASFVKTCHSHLALVEQQLKAALVKAPVLQKARNRLARWQRGLVGSRLLYRSADALRSSSEQRTRRSGRYWDCATLPWNLGP